MNWLGRMRNWINRVASSIRSRMVRNRYRFGDVTVQLGRFVARCMAIGIIFNIIANYFWPEFPSRFPILYGWFDGWLTFGEYVYKVTIGGLYAMFTGNWTSFKLEASKELARLWSQFCSWAAMIKF